MIENLQDELYQLENKQAKRAKLRANRSWRAKNALFKVRERQNMQNQTNLNYVLKIINQYILAILRTFLNLTKRL